MTWTSNCLPIVNLRQDGSIYVYHDLPHFVRVDIFVLLP